MSKYTKFLKFVCVGISNTTISLLVYYTLKAMGVNYIIATALGYIISSVSGYFLNKIWVFKNKEDKKKSIYKYYILYGSSLLLNVLLMAFQVSVLGISDNLAPLFTLVVTTLYNFYFSKKIVFNPDYKFSFKRIKEEISKHKVYYSVMAVLIVVVGFMFINNIYNQPAADDYTNLLALNEAVPDGEVSDVFEFVPAMVKRAGKAYNEWQGTYFSNYIFFLHPLLISRNMYKFASFMVQVFWLVSIFFFFNSIVDKKKDNKKQIYFLGMLFTILSIMFMYSLAEGIYWITGTVLYIIPFSISLFFLGSLIRYFKTDKNAWFILATILALLLGGTSYVTGLFVGFVLLCTTIYLFWKKDDRKFKFLGLLIAYCIAFAFNVFAPGNNNRVKTETGVGLIGVIRITIANAYEMIKKLLFGTIYIRFVILSIPVIKKIVEKSKIKFEKPILLSILCLACFASFFGPMALAYREYYQETRVMNIQLLYLIIMFTVCIINYYGYLYQNKKIKERILPDSGYILFGLVSMVVMISAVGVNNIEGVKMVEDVLYSRSGSFNGCMDSINKYFVENKGGKVEPRYCEIYPYTLHYHKLAKDFWVTDAIERYYDVEIVWEEE